MMQPVQTEYGRGCGKNGRHGQRRGQGQGGHGRGCVHRQGGMTGGGMRPGFQGRGGVVAPQPERAADSASGVRVRCEVDLESCRGCGACLEACERGALRLATREDGDRCCVVDDVRCTGCGVCIAACPTGAARLTEARDRTPEKTYEI